MVKRGATKKAHWAKRLFNPVITFTERWYPIALVLAALTLLLVISVDAYGRDNSGIGSQTAGDNGTIGNPHHSHSDSTPGGGEAIGRADSSSQINSETDTILNLKREYKATAQAVSLALPYCGKGGTIGTVKVTASFGDVDFNCKARATIRPLLALIPSKIEQAENETDPAKKRLYTDEARRMMDNLYSVGFAMHDQLMWDAAIEKVWDVMKLILPVVAILLI